MVVKIVQKGDEIYSIASLVEKIKKNKDVDSGGAIFTFEGFVRGKEDNSKVKELNLTTTDIENTQKELEELVENVSKEYDTIEISVVHYIGKFYTGDSLFLVAILGKHRKESLAALNDIIEKVKFDLDFQKEEISDSGTKIILSGG
ncbi:MAG: molybdenum cofactor biosynthesis protein MoaE [Methanobrevibacter sp.]|jgi:molybdopterin synthase catalytic subunit|nr:molybdenum cofactor biosynthesis protein MoaE [Candidatus Methanoflexus mossambicus]